MSEIKYETNKAVTLEEFHQLLTTSTLGERRPIDDKECLQGMLDNSNLIVSAWDGSKLVGIARSVTDFYYACYLSNLAVDQNYQRQGIGIRLQQITQEQLQPKCTLILISAPAGNSYYPSIGYESCQRCWILPPEKQCGAPPDSEQC
jgi:ribosomal protein S18 acetylase RimI-like enzyme